MSKQQHSTMISAAGSAEEAEFIADVVDDLLDDEPKQTYASWLEERGDARGAFLREFTSAAARLGATPLPDSSAFQKTWRDSVGVTLIEGIADFNLCEHKAEILKLAQPTLCFETQHSSDDVLPIGSSKFGGLPDLATGVRWPTCLAGPQMFLGQFNLADLKLTQVARWLPVTGLLSFFVFVDDDNLCPGWEEWDDLPKEVFSLERQCESLSGPPNTWKWRVIYAADESELARVEAPEDLEDYNEVRPACAIAMRESLDLPDDTSPWAKVLGAGDESGWDHSEVRERLVKQEGCLSANHLLGYTGLNCVGGDPLPGPDWCHLLTLLSDGNAEWEWGDGYHLAFYIREQDLRQGNFDAPLVYTV